MSLYVSGFWILLATLTAIAWLARTGPGGLRAALAEPEVGVATLLSVAAVLTVLLRPAFATRFRSLDPAMLTIDFALFAGLAACGALSGRWWAICAAALQLVSATAHVARLTTPGMWRLGYQVMEEASSYPTLLLLAIGLIERHRRSKTAARSRSFSFGLDARPADRR